MDISWETSAFASHVRSLPDGIIERISKSDNGDFLKTISTVALIPEFTLEAFSHFQRIALDVCARWPTSQYSAAIAAYGRILPDLPHLSELAQRFLSTGTQSPDLLRDLDLSASENETTRELLLGILRLLKYDNAGFAKLLRPAKLQLCLHHDDRSIRYIAIRILCLYIHASDNAMQKMITKYLGTEDIDGPWEGKVIDYRFFSLWEEKRSNDFVSKIGALRDRNVQHSPNTNLKRIISAEDFSPSVVDVSGVLLLRSVDEPSHKRNAKSMVATESMQSNARQTAAALTQSNPILLTGRPGSGKTHLIIHIASLLNKASSMVTLHLNEQSDVKLLLGIYATGERPGSFKWQPGVLTTAVREGRWVLIEDLDRAPNEVISTILPLIENNELVTPGRSEKIRAAQGFKIIATMRSQTNLHGDETVPTSRMLGSRLWTQVYIQSPTTDELQEIITMKLPMLKRLLPRILAVFRRLQQETAINRSLSLRRRPISSRELLKWAGRIHDMLVKSGIRSGDESIPEQTMDGIFLDAVDCFASSIEEDEPRTLVVSLIAEELHLGLQRGRHLLEDRRIRHNLVREKSCDVFIVGRATLPRWGGVSNKLKSVAPFALNRHSLRLLEQVAVAAQRKEPMLLVGETGIGKTTAVQHLARSLGLRLLAINLSQQSESGDLLGGFKPVNVRSLIMPLKEEFDLLFEESFSQKKNQHFIDVMNKSIAQGHWKRILTLWREALKMVDKALEHPRESEGKQTNGEAEQSSKRRKIASLRPTPDRGKWNNFADKVEALEPRLSASSSAFAFSFTEGKLVKAVREGQWVLLDEINLAAPDTLECLSDLLDGGPDSQPFLLLTETGNVERVEAHPNFRIFAAMNPATDVGKKDLPLGIRSRFTEVYVTPPDQDPKSLQNIVETYLEGLTTQADRKMAVAVAELYGEIQKLVSSAEIVDGTNQKPHFSLRSLTRALTHSGAVAPQCGLRRALYEGFSMCFFTCLDLDSEQKLQQVVKLKLFGDAKTSKAELKKPLRPPDSGKAFTQVTLRIQSLERGKPVREELHWIPKGSGPIEDPEGYIVTPFIRRNLENLMRAASSQRYPVLIQGPTSAGKTSMVEYLAKRSGNKFVRINNHEHTDLQEYLGTYVSTSEGQLIFQEGVLVQALRKGHWVVLDELNLAPTDVLEALNRLLDDNRELLIPETQEIVKPHPDFLLFATQNPSGPYGGRKVLSRAFRNRFLELQFDDIPVEELNVILSRRSNLPESWCAKIVEVYKRLSQLRQENRLFEHNSFATLRDLFRWAFRGADSVEQLAVNGYMLLAEKVRKSEERSSVKQVIQEVMSGKGVRVAIDDSELYSINDSREASEYNKSGGGNVIWTKAMQRLFVLVSNAIRHNEPVLLVGETGCGKTTVCQMLAKALSKRIHIVNAHQNTETGDLIGAQRPVRNRGALDEQLTQDLQRVSQYTDDSNHLDLMHVEGLLAVYDKLTVEQIANIPAEVVQRIRKNRTSRKALFEWHDGSIVQAMRAGDYYLLDEISLADDSVLERLNSVLDPQRSLLLAEKGSNDSLVVASDGFQFLATMNPGGDFGKKELSPALRNRFTEIWVPPMTDNEDVLEIVKAKLSQEANEFSEAIVNFAQWFGERYSSLKDSSISIRDVLAWVNFVNAQQLPALDAVIHGAAMVYIDTLGANPSALVSMTGKSIEEERNACLSQLGQLLTIDVFGKYYHPVEIRRDANVLQAGPFRLPIYENGTEDTDFHFNASTTKLNAMRVIRGLQLSKPILLEGNPGVGKTTIITAIAKAVGKPLTRINLSEQTDLMDLFGSDAPVENGGVGQFAWRDAPFLMAMKTGGWVLLDEMNLATQSVLEGLNACLDHRGEVYVAELDQVFKRHPDFRLFAAQNPHHQGSGRKGLPSSFVNRFTVVYADVFKQEDLTSICTQLFPKMDFNLIGHAVNFVTELDSQVSSRRGFGSKGSPWEFNLRDTIRWLQLLSAYNGLLPAGSARDFFDCLFSHRFRSHSDVLTVRHIFESTFHETPARRNIYANIGARSLQFGLGLLSRDEYLQVSPDPGKVNGKYRLATLESLMVCIQQNWPIILVGSSGAGKTYLLRSLAFLTGAELEVFPMSSDIDATDLVGGYEQVDPSRQLQKFLRKLLRILQLKLSRDFVTKIHGGTQALLEMLHSIISTDKVNIDMSVVRTMLLSLAQQDDTLQLENLTTECNNVMKLPQSVESARFEWVDGSLTEAIEQGKWLVLDNANLCSSSVLDRLNSLLEPNGHLIVNEHCNEDGSAKIVKPHPNFRVFLTLDPQYGEVSRAMRNRSVELYLSNYSTEQDGQSSFEIVSESTMMRFQQLLAVVSGVQDARLSEEMIEAALGTISLADTNLLPKFVEQLKNGLSPSTSSAMYSVFERMGLSLSLENSLGRTKQYYRTVTSHIANTDDFVDVQSIQPLCNEALVAYNRKIPSDHNPFLQNQFYFLILSLAEMDQRLKEAQEQVNIGKATSRLHRSFATQIGIKSKPESTTRVAPFLLGVQNTLIQWAKSKIQNGLRNNDQETFLFIKSLQVFCMELYSHVASLDFDEAMFRAFLIFEAKALSRAVTTDASAELVEEISAHIERVKSFSEPTTGQSMQRLWPIFRSHTVSSFTQLQSIMQLESLAEKFDDILWRVDVPIPRLLEVRQAIIRALSLGHRHDVDVDALSLDLETSVHQFQFEEDSQPQEPLFQEIFESICQYEDLQKILGTARTLGKLYSEISMFAKRRTATLGSSSYLDGSAKLLDELQRYTGATGPTNRPLALQENVHYVALTKLIHTGDVSLDRLDLLESELPLLGQTFAARTDLIILDQHRLLQNLLGTLMLHVLTAHRDLMKPTNASELSRFLPSPEAELVGREETIQDHTRNLLQLTSTTSADGRIQAVLEKHMVSSLQCLLRSYHLDPSGHSLAQAFVHFSYACIMLYVPDVIFDPALSDVAAKKLFSRQHEELSNRLEAERELERLRSDITTNLRCQVLESQLKELGDAPAAAPVPRPPVSKLPQLQNDFNALLAVAERNKALPTHLDSINDALSNVLHVIDRLRRDHRVYQDLTGPAIGFLQCSIIGLTLSQRHLSVYQSPVCEYLFRKTPLLGLPLDTWHGGYDTVLNASEKTNMHALMADVLRSTVESPPTWSMKRLEDVESCLLFFYAQWKEQLKKDRKNQDASSSIYHYKGTQEEPANEEAEFDDMFPTFETSEIRDELHEHAKTGDQREHATMTAGFHMNIFLENAFPPLEAFLQLLRFVGSTIGKETSGMTPGFIEESGARLLPIIMLEIEDHQNNLNPSKLPADYNIYKGANIRELKRLRDLVKQIQQRFKMIQSVWPEHATLQHVLDCCQEVLAFRISEPIMKVLTKAEQLYGYVTQWQSVASREFSVHDPLNKLTDVLISWRRLELTTWSQLLNMESTKCNEDAKSWWFLLYENIGYSAGGLELNTVTIVQTLQDFIVGSTRGQYEMKLRMLRSLMTQLRIMQSHNTDTRDIVSPLENLLSHYSRFSPSVNESILKTREKLEKDLKDVIKLASWNDRNIESLKQSARTSHRKLFRLVRKFRDSLNQPVQPLLKESPAPILAYTHEEADGIHLSPEAQSQALIECQKKDVWLQRPARFQNVGLTASRISNMAQLPEIVMSHRANLDDFVGSLGASIEELRKATPSTLTEENSALSKHLTARKRKLLADTLKFVRQMGLPSNISSNQLMQQDSLSKVVAITPSLSLDHRMPTISAGERYLQSSLDLMPDVRRANKEHNEELNSAEVERSVGYLEGLLALSIRQRSNLGPSAKQLHELSSLIETMACLWSEDGIQIKVGNADELTNARSLEKIVTWLPSIISVTRKLLQTQANLGNLDFSVMLEELQAWFDTFQNYRSALPKETPMPQGMLSVSQSEMIERVTQDLEKLNEKLSYWISQYPDSMVILTRLSQWTSSSNLQIDEDVDTAQDSFDDKHEDVLPALDLILGTIQDVQAAIKATPESSDEQAWLTKHETSLSSTLQAFRAPRVISAFTGLLENLKHFQDDAEGFSYFSASLFLAVPIVEQYRRAFEDCLKSYAALHSSTANVLHQLAKHFCNLASQGFCTPKEQSNEKAAGSEKLESGTGLGEGEGAEDISKDIGDDEDLSELAQDPQNGEKEGEVEDNKDAVDIDDNLEGGKGDGLEEQDDDGKEVGDKNDDQDARSEEAEDDTGMDDGGGEGYEEEDAKDEGMGEVGDQEPSAVDEKMWDNPEENAAEDKEGQQATGTKNKDEQVAASEGKKEKNPGEAEGGEEDDDADDESDESAGSNQDEGDVGADEDNEPAQGDLDSTDPHLKESEGLELPDELKLDGDQASDREDVRDDSDDDLSDDLDAAEEPHIKNQQIEPDVDEEMEESKENGDLDNSSQEEQQDHENDVTLPKDSEMTSAEDNEAQSRDEEAGIGQAGQNSNENQNQEDQALEMDLQAEGVEQDQQDQTTSANSAQRQTGSRQEAENKQSQDAQGDPDVEAGGAQQQESKDLQAIRKLGDILEKWHKQQRKIHEPSSEGKNPDRQQQDLDMGNNDFEHLPDEEAEADTQAMGPSTQEQATAVDDSMAVEETTVGEKELDNMPSIAQDEADDSVEDVEMNDADDIPQDEDQDNTQSQAKAFVDNRTRADSAPFEEQHQSKSKHDPSDSDTSSIQDDLSTLQLTQPNQLPHISQTDPHALWSHYLSITHTASLHLTEQLRLILEPTRATKLSGAFRTGKRLNIKRIIPYIASSYKRDKIWLRRSVPQKRDYQICLAIDDSRSMDPHGVALGDANSISNGNANDEHNTDTETGNDSPAALAFQTLALLSSSLHALDAGALSVLAFGSQTGIAHPLTSPWAASSGGDVLSNFTFAQTRTDVVALVDAAVEMFRDARSMTAGGGGETWQICLVVGDGVFGEHDAVRRRVVSAKEERVMFVFVIVDAVAHRNQSQTTGTSNGKSKDRGNLKETKQSILDLETVEFVQSSSGDEGEQGPAMPQIKRTKYLDTFPFEFYLVVRDVAELPGVLATALRQWFNEIGGVAG